MQRLYRPTPGSHPSFPCPDTTNSCKLRPATLRKDSVMSIHPIMQKLAAKLERTDHPNFGPGDTVRVQVKIKEGEKERLQAFEGLVIATNKGPQGTFTVR